MKRAGSALDVLVVGAGIAGLTAALHAAWRGKRVAVVESALPGGLVVNVGALEGFPAVARTSGAELAAALQSQAMELGVEFVEANVASLDAQSRVFTVSAEDAGSYRAKSVVWAAGARLRALSVPGAERLWQKGVSQCAFCDAGLYRDQPVVVIGGGDAALQEAQHLLGYASRVTLVHRRNRLRAQQHYVSRAADAPNMQFRWTSEITEVLGDVGVEGVRIRHVDTGDEQEIECRAVFPFIGVVPHTSPLPEAAERDETGAAVVDKDLMTDIPGLYVIGAARVGFGGQLVHAASDGAVAAAAIARRG